MHRYAKNAHDRNMFEREMARRDEALGTERFFASKKDSDLKKERDKNGTLRGIISRLETKNSRLEADLKEERDKNGTLRGIISRLEADLKEEREENGTLRNKLESL